jgi:formate/nitrite transporter FocA (FNT family)
MCLLPSVYIYAASQVTLGNIIGGAVAVAGMYSFAFGSLGKKAKLQL